MNSKFLETLFDQGEGVTLGDQFSTRVRMLGVDELPESPNFFCINPLNCEYDYALDRPKPARKDLNVTSFRSFLFEMDGVGLDDQLKILNNSSIPFTSVVYSGGKSYHAIICLEKPLTEPAHTRDGVMAYKAIWRRLAALIDKEAKSMGYELPGDAESFVDHSCKNPSRLSRFPGVFREDKGKTQELVRLSSRMPAAEFSALIARCPEVTIQDFTIQEKPEDLIDDLDAFQSLMPDALRRRLKFVDWAADHDMYPKIYRFSTWAIDSTNVSKQCFLEFLEKYTFPILLQRGYPSSKLTVAVDHAFSKKGQP